MFGLALLLGCAVGFALSLTGGGGGVFAVPIAASMLQATGLEVVNMTGGFGDWNAAGLSVDKSEANAACGAGSGQCT